MDGYYHFKNEHSSYLGDESIFNSQSNAVNMSVVNTLDGSHTIRDMNLSNEEVLSRLRLDPDSNPDPNPSTSAGVSESVHLLQVAWIRRKWASPSFQIDILKSMQESILQRFEISEDFFQYACHPLRDAFFRFSDDELGSQLFAIGIPDRCLVIWKHHPGTAQVNIVCWADEYELKILKSAFQWSQMFARDPLVPFIFTVMALEHWIDKHLQENVVDITEVETRTQFTNWLIDEKYMPNDSDTALTARMGGTAASLAHCEENCFLGVRLLTSMFHHNHQRLKTHVTENWTGFDNWVQMLQQRSVSLAVVVVRFLACMPVDKMIYIILPIHVCFPTKKIKTKRNEAEGWKQSAIT